MEVQMLQIVRTQRQFRNDKLDVLIFKLKLLEHGDQILSGDSVLTVFDVLKGRLQLIRISTCHLSDPHYHLLLLAFFHQGEILNDLSQFTYQDCDRSNFILIYFVFLIAVTQKGFGVI